MRRRTLQVEEELSQSRRVSACPGSSSDTARSGAAAPGRPRRSVMGMGKGAMEMSEERVALSARRRSRIPVSEKSPEETNTGSEHVSNAALQGRRRAAGGVRDSMCPSLESGGRSEALSNRRRSRMPAREEANTVHIAVEREEMGRNAASSEQISQPRRSVMGGGRHSVMGPRERGGQRSALSARRVSRMPPVSVTTSSFPAAVVHDVVVAVEAAEVAEEEAIKASGSPQSVSVSVSVPTILPAGKGGPKRPRRRMMGGVDKLLEPRAGGPISARRRSCMPGKEASGGSEEVREELPVLKKESDTVKDSAIAEAVVPHSRAQTVRQSLCRASLSTTPGGRNALSARRKSRMPKKKETKVVEAEQCMEETEKKNTRERRTRAAKKVESLGEEEEEEDEEEEEMTTTVNERNVKETANMIIEADYNMVEDNYEEKQTQVGGEVDEVVKNEEENEEEVEAEVEEKEEEKEELEDGEKQSNEDSCVWDVLSGLRRHAVGVKRSKLDENGIVIAYSERRLESKLRAMEAEAAELHRRQMEEEEKKKKKKSVTTHVPSPAVTHTEAARGRKSSASLVESDSDFSVETLGNAGEESESETEELTEKGERGRRVTDEVEDEMVDEDEEEDQIESDDDEEEGEEEEVGVEEVGEKEEGDEVERDEEEEEDVEEQCTVVIRPNRGVGKLEVAVQSVARTRKRSRGNEKKTAGAVENRRVEVEEREEDGKEIGEVDSIKEDRDEEQVDEEDSEDDSVTMDLVNTGEIVHPPRPSSRSSRTSRSTRQSSVRSSSISKSQQHAPRASSIATYTGSSPSFINDASSMATVQKEVTPLLRKRSSTSTKTSVSSGAKRKSFSRAFKNSPARRVNIKVEESAAETGAPPSKKTRRSSSSSPTTMTEAAADTSPNVWNKPVTSSVSTTTDKVVTATSLETSLAKTADTILTLKERIEMMKKRTHQKMGIKPDTHLSIVSTSTPSSSSSSTTTPSTTTTVSPITQVTSTAVIPPTASATNTASQVTETVTCAKSDFVEEVSIGSSTASSIIDMEEKLATSFLAEERERRKRENLEEFKKRQEERKRSRKEEKERRAIQKKNREFLLQAVHKKVEATQATSSKATTTTTTSTANTNAATSTMDSSRIIRMEGAGVKRSGPSTAAANGADGGRSREESLAKRMKKTASSSTFQPTLSSASSQNIASSSLTSFSTLAPVASKMRAKLETNKTIKREQVNEKKPESEPTTEPTDSNMFVSEQDELFFGFADELNKLIAVSTTSLNSERNGKDHMTKGGDVEDDGVEGEGRDSPFCQDQFGGNDHGSGAPAEDLLIIDNVPCSNALPSSTSVTSTSSSLPMSPSRMSPQASAAAVDDFVFVTPIKKVPQQQSHIQTSTSTNTPKSNFASVSYESYHYIPQQYIYIYINIDLFSSHLILILTTLLSLRSPLASLLSLPFLLVSVATLHLLESARRPARAVSLHLHSAQLACRGSFP